jgi:hypothetical protein
MLADRSVLELLKQACQYQMNGMAFDLIHRLRTDKCLSAAIKVANHFGRSKIAEAVDEIIEQRARLQEQAFEMDNNSQSNFGNHPTSFLSTQQDYQEQDDVEPVQQFIRKPTPQLSKQSFIDLSDHSNSIPTQASMVAPVNPFALKSAPQNNGGVPLKRKSVLEGFQEMKGNSPSPKKPLLQVSLPRIHVVAFF